MLHEPHTLMKFFKYDHLPDVLKKASMPICKLAHDLDLFLPDNVEKTVALRKMLEAKDAAVRSIIEGGGLDIPITHIKSDIPITGD